MTRLRLFLGPAVLFETVFRSPRGIIGATLIIGLLTDIFDGVIARRLRIVTAELRVADSKADGVYTFCVLAAICGRMPGPMLAVWPGLAVVAGLEAISTTIDYVKYGRPCSHHPYSAKLWAASFCVVALAVLIWSVTEPFLLVCIALGIVNNLEGYVIRLLLPMWAHDVSGIPAAVRLRRIQLAEIEAGTIARRNPSL